MCKLFCILDIENQANAERFARKAVPFVTRTDNHGLGIMRLGENGIHIQRWLDIPKKLEVADRVSSKYKNMLRLESNESGKPSKRIDAIAIHGRFATCGISLENTHPFYLDGTALMHNGIISNTKYQDNVVSSCDSEALLHRYKDFKLRDNPLELSNAMKDISGYYAVIAFNDNGVVDIWRDEQAELVLAYVQGVGNVIATNADLIYQTARRCHKRVSFCYPVLPFTHLRWEKTKPPKISSFEKTVPQAIGKYDYTGTQEGFAERTFTKDVQHFDDHEHWWRNQWDDRDAEEQAQQALKIGGI